MALFLRFLAFLTIFNLIFATTASAQTQNNKFGIHISDLNELDKASDLVNSEGGAWGYVPLLINSNDRVVDKWQSRMNALNEKKLIPIVRLVTYPNGDTWVKPSKDDAHDWAVFLNKLYWPTKKKIVMVYNEPNHATEWGGDVNPADYARVLNETIDELKKSDSNFVVLNAGFDASAPQKLPGYMDQVRYMDEMEKSVPGIFNKLDGWSSHSYPNPGFSGKPTDTGRGSIRTYDWELNLLRTRYNVTKDMPVYITETGWVVKNTDHPSLRVDETTAAQYIRQAFEQVWMPDQRVVAVIPFMLTYKHPLFSHFSWIKPDDTESEQYKAVRSLAKQAGQPEQENRSILTNVSVPSQIPQRSEIIATLAFKNTGNTIWTNDSNITLNIIDENAIVKRKSVDFSEKTKILPGQSYVFRFTLYTEDIITRAPISFQLQKNETPFGEKLYTPVKVYQPPKLTVNVIEATNKPVQNVSVSFVRSRERDTLDRQAIPAGGSLGTFSSKLFVPGIKIEVEVLAPNRDVVRKEITLKEGENDIQLVLPPEKSLWERLFNR